MSLYTEKRGIYTKTRYSCPKCGREGLKLRWFCLVPGDYYRCESCRFTYFVPDEPRRNS